MQSSFLEAIQYDSVTFHYNVLCEPNVMGQHPTLLKIFKGTLRVLPLVTIQMQS